MEAKMSQLTRKEGMLQLVCICAKEMHNSSGVGHEKEQDAAKFF
jgi:hypothetical protein